MAIRTWTSFVALLAGVAGVLGLATTSTALAAHVSCGDVITIDTKLDSDLIDCPQFGVSIGAPGITLDLNGHTIDGAQFSNSGVNDQAGFDDVTVKNGAIRQFSNGVALQGTTGVLLQDLSLEDNLSFGARLVGSDGNALERVSAHGNGLDGINLEGANANRIEDGEASANGYAGVNLWHSDRSTITGVHVEANAQYGILIQDNSNADVDANTLTGNVISGGFYGIVTSFVSDSHIDDNFVSGASFTGIQLTDSPRIVVRGNTVVESGEGLALMNINVSGPDGVRITGNTLSATGGIRFYRADGNVVDGNTIRPAAIGIYLNFADDNTFASNDVRGGQWGIQSIGNSARNRYDSNRLSKAEVDGLEIGDFEGVVTGNFAVNNGDDGIDVEGGTQIVGGNAAHANGDLGIEADLNTTDAGGNRASGNRNRLQCRNVACK
jgi:parallel beta-helix repeat protein